MADAGIAYSCDRKSPGTVVHGYIALLSKIGDYFFFCLRRAALLFHNIIDLLELKQFPALKVPPRSEADHIVLEGFQPSCIPAFHTPYITIAAVVLEIVGLRGHGVDVFTKTRSRNKPMLAAVAALGQLCVATLALLDFFLYMVEYAADQSGKKRPQQEVVILIRNPINLPDFGKVFFD